MTLNSKELLTLQKLLVYESKRTMVTIFMAFK